MALHKVTLVSFLHSLIHSFIAFPPPLPQAGHRASVTAGQGHGLGAGHHHEAARRDADEEFDRPGAVPVVHLQGQETVQTRQGRQ